MNFNHETTVSVVMITYAHEKFIRQAIEGVLMQKCNFSVELIISNDCSPDNTDDVVQDILKIHPNANWIKYTKQEHNLGMMPNFLWTIKQAKGKYVSYCEGDDYWTDPNKLQKQVDFLENNNRFSCHAHQSSIIEEGKKSKLFREKVFPLLNVYDLIEGRQFHTASILFRKSALTLFNQYAGNVFSGDRFLFLCIAIKGDIFYSEQQMCIYRKHPGGISVNVKVEQIKKDINSLDFLKANFKSFPVLRYKSYIYVTIALCKNSNLLQKVYFLTLSFIYSFSYFPQNLVKFTKAIIK